MVDVRFRELDHQCFPIKLHSKANVSQSLFLLHQGLRFTMLEIYFNGVVLTCFTYNLLFLIPCALFLLY